MKRGLKIFLKFLHKASPWADLLFLFNGEYV